MGFRDALISRFFPHSRSLLGKHLVEPSTGLNTINQRMLKRLVIPVPPKPEQEKITAVIAQQRKHLEALVAKQQGFETLKKSLMHDLLTGRVRVQIAQ